MQDLKLVRVWIEVDEYSEQIHETRVAIHPADIHFYEEYKGEPLKTVRKPLTTVYLYNGEVVVIKEEFGSFYTKMCKYRDKQQKEGFFKRN